MPRETAGNSPDSAHFRPKRFFEQFDPVVEEIMGAETDDRIGHILASINRLRLKQQVHLLLLLSDEEFAQFQERRKKGYGLLVEDAVSGRLPTDSPEERIRLTSLLKHTMPRYEIEAEIRRRRLLQYPPEWDDDLDIDPLFKPNDGLLQIKGGKVLTYEESVEFTRFENTRQWYRNWLFSMVTRRDDPLPLTLTTVNQAFQGEKERLRDEMQPGTAIELSDLISVTNFYEFEHEPDNAENCAVHRQVRAIARFINEINSPTE